MHKFLAIAFFSSILLISCSKTIDNTGTCSDGVRNQGEHGIDCGGPCANACPSCADGILNQGETAVDCGGPCDPCYPRMAATINGTLWNSTSRNAFISGPGTVRIYGTNQQYNLTLYYSGPFNPGNIASGSQFTGEFRDENGNIFTSVSGGSISFSTFDTVSRTVSGTFQFAGFNPNDSTTVTVSGGLFNVLNY